MRVMFKEKAEGREREKTVTAERGTHKAGLQGILLHEYILREAALYIRFCWFNKLPASKK